MTWIRWLGLTVGVLVMGVLIHHVGWAEIHHSLTLLGAGYAVVLTYPVLWILCNTQGWNVIVQAHHTGVAFKSLFQIRMAGESFNALLPSGYVGGEPLKAKLLSEQMPLRDAASSVLVAKAAQSVGLVLFIGLGLTLGGRSGLPVGSQTSGYQWMALSVLIIGVGLFVFLLSRRSFSHVAGVLHAWTRHPWLLTIQGRLLALDVSLGVFYRDGKRAFLKSFVWHALGWTLGALEVCIIFWLIGHPLGFREAWFIGALAQLGSVIGLFAPAGVGLYEGGHYLAAQMLGLPPVLGVSVALIRRVRELAWNALGIFYFWWLTKKKFS